MSGHKTENSENNFIEKTALTIVPDDALSASASEEETPVDDLHVTDVTIVQGDHPAGPVPGEESASKGKASADNAYVTDVTIVQEDHPATPLPDGDATPDSAHASGAVPPGARHDTDMTMLQHEPLPASSSSRGNGDQLQPGDRLDRYVIVKKLGQGGMGSVYLVRHETLGVFRAAKVLSSELYARGGEFVKRFVQEAKLACSISNPNIVNVLDVCDDPEPCVIIQMMSTVFSVYTKPSSSVIMVTGFNNGKVIFQKRCHALHPSKAAASYKSTLMFCRPEYRITRLNGIPSQMLAIITAHNE